MTDDDSLTFALALKNKGVPDIAKKLALTRGLRPYPLYFRRLLPEPCEGGEVLTIDDFQPSGHTTNPQLPQAIFPNGTHIISTFNGQLTIDTTTTTPATIVPTDQIHAPLTDIPH